MLITNQRLHQPRPTRTAAAQETTALSQGDEVSLGVRAGFGLMVGALGLVPGVGAATNLAAGMGAVWDRNSAAGLKVGLAGGALNGLGTAALIGGHVFGNDICMKAGMTAIGLGALSVGVMSAVLGPGPG